MERVKEKSLIDKGDDDVLEARRHRHTELVTEEPSVVKFSPLRIRKP